MTPTEREQKFPEWYLEIITKMGVQPDEALVWLDFLLERGWRLDVCLHEQALGWWRRHTAAFFDAQDSVAQGWSTGDWYIGMHTYPTRMDSWDPRRWRNSVTVRSENERIDSTEDSSVVWDAEGQAHSITFDLGPEFTPETLQKWQSFLQWHRERTLAQATSPLHSRQAEDR